LAFFLAWLNWIFLAHFMILADVAGNVRIWDTVGEEQMLKSEIKPISGRITDIAWDSESKRLIAVGEGKERYVCLLATSYRYLHHSYRCLNQIWTCFCL
jgi:WD40 repeat protein